MHVIEFNNYIDPLYMLSSPLSTEMTTNFIMYRYLLGEIFSNLYLILS